MNKNAFTLILLALISMAGQAQVLATTAVVG